MTTQTCTCPVPFNEDSIICSVCEQAWIDTLTQINDDAMPTDWDEFARQQG